MQETALAITTTLECVDHPIVCSLTKYYPEVHTVPEEKKLLEKDCFIWDSEAIVQQGDGYALESKFQLRYQPPKDPGRVMRLFGKKIQERCVSNHISLELTIRNLAKDPDFLRKICLGSPMGGSIYLVGDALGGSIGPYYGEDIRLEFTERLWGQMIFGIPMFHMRDDMWSGGGMPRSFPTLTQKTQPFEDYLRNILPHLTHTTSDYSRELGKDLSQREAQYFRRHVELIKEYLGLPHQLESIPLPPSR